METHNNPYLEVLEHLNSGALFDLSEQLAECVERSTETGKQSTLTLKLIIKPEGNTGQFEIRDEVKRTLPALPRRTTLMFANDKGFLQREDPKQQNLNLKTVDTQPAKFTQVK